MHPDQIHKKYIVLIYSSVSSHYYVSVCWLYVPSEPSNSCLVRWHCINLYFIIISDVCYRVGNARPNMRNPRMLSTESGGNRLRRNGNIPAVQNQTSNMPARSNNNDDIDIQILQQKKQQAEIKRYSVSHAESWATRVSVINICVKHSCYVEGCGRNGYLMTGDEFTNNGCMCIFYGLNKDNCGNFWQGTKHLCIDGRLRRCP